MMCASSVSAPTCDVFACMAPHPLCHGTTQAHMFAHSYCAKQSGVAHSYCAKQSGVAQCDIPARNSPQKRPPSIRGFSRPFAAFRVRVIFFAAVAPRDSRACARGGAPSRPCNSRARPLRAPKTAVGPPILHPSHACRLMQPHTAQHATPYMLRGVERRGEPSRAAREGNAPPAMDYI